MFFFQLHLKIDIVWSRNGSCVPLGGGGGGGVKKSSKWIIWASSYQRYMAYPTPRRNI